MLLVSNFNPAVKISDNRNIRTNNSRRKFYKSQPTVVSFKSTQAELTSQAEEAIGKITQDFLIEYSGIFGKNFKKVFLNPWEKFLKKKGVSIKLEPSEWETRTHIICLNYGSVENGYNAQLVNSEGKRIHSWGVDKICGATKNHAKVNLIKEFVNGELDMYDNTNKYFPNPLKNIRILDELKEIAKKVNDALIEFQWEWVRTPHDRDDLKVKRLQRAFKKLMPED